MDTLRRDLAYALRALRAQPGFTLTALLVLALGIGATTAIFSVANAVLLRPLPYADADRLVLVWGELRARELTEFPFPAPDFKDLGEQAPAFAELAAVTPGQQALAGDGAGPPERISATGVTPNALTMLGARVLHGRGFVPEDATPAAPPAFVPQGDVAAAGPPPEPPITMVVLNHGFWQRRYGGDPAVVGRVLELGGGQRAEVVGVLAPGFELLFPPEAGMDAVPDMFAAMRIDYANASPINVFLRVIGRLAPGATVATAQAQADLVAADLRERFPIKNTAGLHFDVRPMHADLVREVRPAIVALTGAVAFVLLIACANVANLLLVRAAARNREFAVRAALGSSAGRLVRQLLAESLVLSIGGALLGLLVAWVGVRALVALAPPNLPRLDAVRLDPTVLLFAAGLAVVAAALFGLAPAIRASRPDLGAVLRAGRTGGLVGGKLLRNAIVTAEVALSFVLLVGGGLMVRSFVALQQADPGYDASGVLTFSVDPQAPQPEARAAFMRRMRERLGALPGVSAVTAANPLPLDGTTANARWGTAEAAADPAKFQQANVHIVLPGYFAAMRTPVLAGRVYGEEDDRPDITGIVIDRVLAEKAFPGANAVGQRLLVRVRGPEPEWLDVIGVVEHQRHETLAADGREAIFFPDGFFGHGAAGTWAVRTTGDPNALVPGVRAIVAELDPRLPLADVQPMSVLVDRAQAATRFALVLIATFAGIAALLAAVGLYGVLSTAVRQRTAEIGVRMAFGAPTRRIFGLVVGEGLLLCAVGVALGLAAAVPLTRVIESLLVGVRPTDPLTFVAMSALFLVIAAIACWLPARRAARLDPTVALRAD
jgi:predicted permease